MRLFLSNNRTLIFSIILTANTGVYASTIDDIGDVLKVMRAECGYNTPGMQKKGADAYRRFESQNITITSDKVVYTVKTADMEQDYFHIGNTLQEVFPNLQLPRYHKYTFKYEFDKKSCVFSKTSRWLMHCKNGDFLLEGFDIGDEGKEAVRYFKTNGIFARGFDGPLKLTKRYVALKIDSEVVVNGFSFKRLRMRDREGSVGLLQDTKMISNFNVRDFLSATFDAKANFKTAIMPSKIDNIDWQSHSEFGDFYCKVSSN